MNVTLPSEVEQQFSDMFKSLSDRLDFIKKQGTKDLEIDEIDLDSTLLAIPKLHGKWLSMYTDEVQNLKNLYALKEKTKLERWKFYCGKQSDSYIAKNGIIHEKILKTDVDKYLSADPKMERVDRCISVQKTITDYIEKTMKEIGNMGFHIKSIIEWRKFCSGAN